MKSGLRGRFSIMSTEDRKMCQLQWLPEMTDKNHWLVDIIQISIRKYRWYKKLFLASIFRNNFSASKPILNLKPGDRIRVLPKDKIKKTLNRLNKTHGCTFQQGMYAYCDTEYTVLKKVDYFYDEVKSKLCKCKGTYLLDGVRCNGHTAYLVHCDRYCYFFWNSAWLELIAS
jgi:hypothetical protein